MLVIETFLRHDRLPAPFTRVTMFKFIVFGVSFKPKDQMESWKPFIVVSLISEVFAP